MTDEWKETEPREDVSEEHKLSSIRYQMKKLNAFPRVKNKITLHWGTKKGRDTIVGLLIDDRDRHNNKVQGFPEHIYKTLGVLLELHDKHYSQFKPRERVWDWDIT